MFSRLLNQTAVRRESFFRNSYKGRLMLRHVVIVISQTSESFSTSLTPVAKPPCVSLVMTTQSCSILVRFVAAWTVIPLCKRVEHPKDVAFFFQVPHFNTRFCKLYLRSILERGF